MVIACLTVLSTAAMVMPARQEIIAAPVVVAQMIKPAAEMVAARREILAAATLLAARQDPFAAAIIAAGTVKPAAEMVVARQEKLAVALSAARQDGFAAPIRWDAVLWGQPAREMDTANKKPALEGPVLDS